MRKKFQIVFETEDNAVFDTVSRQKDVDKWLKTFHEKGVIGSSIKIFTIEKNGVCTLLHYETCEDNEMRPVGFGRW